MPIFHVVVPHQIFIFLLAYAPPPRYLGFWFCHNSGRWSASAVDRHRGVDFFHRFGKNKASDGNKASTKIINHVFRPWGNRRLGTPFCGALSFHTLLVQAPISCLCFYNLLESTGVQGVCRLSRISKVHKEAHSCHVGPTRLAVYI